ncbi:hypothetical protein LMG28138_06048 [Pararobbsia alpina]|uniref:Uncharacterized protein n=1 Tax=Pararobbsia alpina TaxID=621374 RepID=A0A6S7BPD8_9BURK|nr:hypothetical protein LMG28138_06048 [Pararobbsia alpina]
MKRLLFAPGIACLLRVTSVFAQSNPDQSNAAIAQNFAFMNHPPPPPVPASTPAATGSARDLIEAGNPP